MPPRVYGHRGTRRGAPENSLAAIRLALNQGADGVEIDVRLCGSGEVVVLHDADLLRVAGVAREVARLSLGELARCELGQGQHVPRLDQVLELVLGAGHRLNIELKRDVPDPVALVRAVVAQAARCAPSERERVVFSSFSPSVCRLLCAALPGATVGLLFDRVPVTPPIGSKAVHPRHDLVTPQSVSAWRAEGFQVNTWTVNDAAGARGVAAAGVDAIITDDVPLVLGAI
jgi:glycerophosphoryl diester phosphodiesterase